MAVFPRSALDPVGEVFGSKSLRAMFIRRPTLKQKNGLDFLYIFILTLDIDIQALSSYSLFPYKANWHTYHRKAIRSHIHTYKYNKHMIQFDNCSILPETRTVFPFSDQAILWKLFSPFSHYLLT